MGSHAIFTTPKPPLPMTRRQVKELSTDDLSYIFKIFKALIEHALSMPL